MKAYRKEQRLVLSEGYVRGGNGAGVFGGRHEDPQTCKTILLDKLEQVFLYTTMSLGVSLVSDFSRTAFVLELDRFLTRDPDRKLFRLSPLHGDSTS